MSTSFHACNNASFRRCRFNNEFNQNPCYSNSMFNFPNYRQIVDFASHCRLFSVDDHKKSPFFTICSKKDADVAFDGASFSGGENAAEALTCVMKFGGSSVATAERMREVAHLILSFPEENPIVVLSAMGITTNNLLCVCGHSKSIYLVILDYELQLCWLAFKCK